MRSLFVALWAYLAASLVLTPIPAIADSLDEGLRAAEDGDYQTAVQLLSPLAEQGDAEAQSLMGLLYFNGWGVQANVTESLQYYRLAVSQGDARAMYYLGDITEKGRHVRQDFEGAVNLYRLSAAKGFAPAQYHLGEMYRDGEGVEKDNLSAHMWFSVAIANDEERGSGILVWLEMAMEPQEIEEARVRASKCLESSFADCGEPVATAPDLLAKTFAQEFAEMLYRGKTDGAIVLAEAKLAAQSDDRQAAFALGSAQFLNAVEKLGQGLYRYGLQSEFDSSFGGLSGLPFLRLPVPENPKPDQVTYNGLRSVLSRFVDDLAVAETTLARVDPGEFDLPLDLERIRLDFDGDGIGSEQETLFNTFSAISSRSVSGTGYGFDFDQSDAPWLQGYSHLLSAMAEFLLAHNWEAAFNGTFHSLFPQSDLPSSKLLYEIVDVLSVLDSYRDEYGNLPTYPYKSLNTSWDEWHNSDVYKNWKAYVDLEEILWIGSIADLAAFAHLFNWPVVEPKRMISVRQHLLEMIALSRENWRRIQSETDNQREWVPSPGQVDVFQRRRVDDDTVAAWHLFLDEFEAILEGHRLIKHWRFVNKGVNLRRMFEEPRTFDPILLAQGSAVIPYLEEGDLVTGDTAETMLNLFGGDFFTYFIWFN